MPTALKIHVVTNDSRGKNQFLKWVLNEKILKSFERMPGEPSKDAMVSTGTALDSPSL